MIDLAEDRTKESVRRCLGRDSINDLADVEAIAMHRWEPDILQLRAIVDNADEKIVFDRFHIVAHMHDALEQVHRRENKALCALGFGVGRQTSFVGRLRGAVPSSCSTYEDDARPPPFTLDERQRRMHASTALVITAAGVHARVHTCANAQAG